MPAAVVCAAECEASTSVLVTWSAATITAATASIASLTRGDLAALSFGMMLPLRNVLSAGMIATQNDTRTRAMMASMKPAKHSVAVVVRAADGTFLVVRRPEDPDDPLAGLWGLPAITLRDGEDEQAAVVRAGRAKLGVDLAAGRKIGEATADRGSHLLRLSDYEATVVAGTPSVPQADTSMTQYVAAMFTDDPTVLGEAAAKGSLCARVFLEATARAPNGTGRGRGFRRRTGLDRLVDVHTHFMPDRLLAAVWAYFDAGGPLLGRPWPIRYREQEQRGLEVLRGFGVRAFTAMLYPHKPGMARSLNDWAADFAARTQDCLHTATFFAEPEAADDVRRAIDQGARVFKCHLQVGGFDPNDPLLDDVWGLLAEAGIPVVTHCGSGPVPGAHTGPGLSRHCSPGTPGCDWSSRTWACPSTRSSSASPSATTGCCWTPPWRSPPSSRRPTRSRAPNCPGLRPSATASCSAPTTPTSRTPTRTRSRPSSGPA